MTPEDFPVVFAEGWALDKPGPFLDYFRPLIHDNATFVQPMFPDAHGPAEVEHMFRKLFSLFPDLPRRNSALCGSWGYRVHRIGVHQQRTKESHSVHGTRSVRN